MLSTKLFIKGLAKKKRNFYEYSLRLLKIENHWVTITNAQDKMYFAYLFLNC